ncbi:MAG: hypothetical protein AAFY80_05210 [Pseudomonadota bacterium]
MRLFDPISTIMPQPSLPDVSLPLLSDLLPRVLVNPIAYVGSEPIL